MKKIYLLISLLSLVIITQAQVKTTICNGNWSDNSIWKDGNKPTIGDSIRIGHYLVLNGNFEMNRNVITIHENSELYISYEFTIPANSKIINYGRLIAPKFSIFGSMASHGKTITDTDYQDYFSLPTCTPVIIEKENNTLESNSEGYDYRWYYNNELIATDTRSIIAEHTGYYTCSYKPTAQDGFSAVSESFYIEIETQSGTLSGSYAEMNTVRIYPNPVSNQNFINISTSATDQYAEIYDITGKRYKSIQLEAGVNKVDLTNIRKGIYLLKINGGNSSMVERIILR